MSLGCSEFIKSLTLGGTDGQRPVFAHGNAPVNQLKEDSCPPTSQTRLGVQQRSRQEVEKQSVPVLFAGKGVGSRLGLFPRLERED